jgi:hypothetical protein
MILTPQNYVAFPIWEKNFENTEGGIFSKKSIFFGVLNLSLPPLFERFSKSH